MGKNKLTEIELKIKTHQLKQIDYKYQSTVSYSQYSVYRRCPHQWYLSYVKNLNTYQSTIHTLFGTALHETFQHYIKIMYEQSAAAADREDLVSLLNERFKFIYKKEFEKNKQHFSNPDEMKEFFEDGINIIEWFKKHRSKFFTTRNVVLLGIEMPLIIGLTNNISLKGYIDLVLYDKDLDKVIIYDIKTSRQGWSVKDKKDELKISQILLYKEFFSKQYDIDIDKIEVEFLILRRKIWESKDFAIPYISSFKPASGKIKRKKTLELFNNFLTECFNKDGKYIDKSYTKIVSKNCKFCPYNQDNKLCDKNNLS